MRHVKSSEFQSPVLGHDLERSDMRLLQKRVLCCAFWGTCIAEPGCIPMSEAIASRPAALYFNLNGVKSTPFTSLSVAPLLVLSSLPL